MACRAVVTLGLGVNDTHVTVRPSHVQALGNSSASFHFLCFQLRDKPENHLRVSAPKFAVALAIRLMVVMVDENVLWRVITMIRNPRPALNVVPLWVVREATLQRRV